MRALLEPEHAQWAGSFICMSKALFVCVCVCVCVCVFTSAWDFSACVKQRELFSWPSLPGLAVTQLQLRTGVSRRRMKNVARPVLSVGGSEEGEGWGVRLIFPGAASYQSIKGETYRPHPSQPSYVPVALHIDSHLHLVI